MDTRPTSVSILIVDDTPQNLRVLAQLLMKHGYKVRAARSGAQAIQSARLDPPTLILLDVMMPELDGYATCAKLKADPVTQDIPIIFLSVLDAVQDKVMAFRAGGVDYITKPFEVPEVLARISTHLRLHALQQQLQAQNQRLEQEILERQHAETQVQLLRELDLAILGVPTLESIATIAATRLRQVLDCQRITVLEFRPDAAPRVLAVEAVGKHDVNFWTDTTCLDVQQLSRRRYVPNLADVAERTPLQEKLYAAGTRAYVSIPLPFRQYIIGALELETERPHAFTSEKIEMATQVAITLAIGIHQARTSLDLQQEVSERKKAQGRLQAYAQELEVSNAELDAFAQTVAHDLKNPLAALVGFAYLLENRADLWVPERIQESARRIMQVGNKMTSIVNELLLLASVRKLESIPRSKLDMEVIVAEAQIRLEAMFTGAEATLTIPKQWPTAVGYAPWVEEVWVNYLSNGLKYGGTPPQLELGWDIEARIMEEDEESGSRGRAEGSPYDTLIRVVPRKTFIRFWVQDNGPGLTSEQREQLFTPFTRLQQARVEGHGLGLSIVQRIITRLGGTVGVESVVGEGSRFYFTLPTTM